MKKGTKLILAFLVVGFAAGALYYTFRKSPDSVKNVKPDYVVDAATLVDEFTEDEYAANQKYLDKTIEVEGLVVDIESIQDEKTFIYLEGSFMGNVQCSFSNSEVQKTSIREGASVKVKGKCTGFIMDVVLTKCSLIKE